MSFGLSHLTGILHSHSWFLPYGLCPVMVLLLYLLLSWFWSIFFVCQHLATAGISREKFKAEDSSCLFPQHSSTLFQINLLDIQLSESLPANFEPDLSEIWELACCLLLDILALNWWVKLWSYTRTIQIQCLPLQLSNLCYHYTLFSVFNRQWKK